MSPEDLFRCLPLHATMRAATCVDRQCARFSGRGGVLHLPCGSGQCAQGREVAAQIPEYKPQKFRQYRGDLRSQRVARERWKAQHGFVPSIDRPAPRDFWGDEGDRKMARTERQAEVLEERLCSGLGSGKSCPRKTKLSPQSKGDRCFQCRLALGEIRKGETRGTRSPRAASGMPSPRSLPTDYLIECAIEGFRKLLEHMRPAAAGE